MNGNVQGGVQRCSLGLDNLAAARLHQVGDRASNGLFVLVRALMTRSKIGTHMFSDTNSVESGSKGRASNGYLGQDASLASEGIEQLYLDPYKLLTRQCRGPH